MSEANTATPEAPAPVVKGNSIPMIVYILFLVGFPVPLAAVAGLILAYVNRSPSDDPVLASHYRYQIRTFWWGLLWTILGVILAAFLVGYLILLVWAVWTLYRVIKGLSAWNKNEAIE